MVSVVIITFQSPKALPWAFVFISFIGVQTASFLFFRRINRGFTKKLNQIEEEIKSAQKYASTVEFRTRGYKPGASAEAVLPVLDKVNHYINTLQQNVTTQSLAHPGSSTTPEKRPTRFTHNAIPAITGTHIGEAGSSGRLAGTVLPDQRNNEYLNYLLYSNDDDTLFPRASTHPSVAFLLGSKRPPQLAEHADTILLRPNQLDVPITTNYLVIEASVLSQGIWSSSLNSTSTAQFLSFSSNLNHSKHKGLIVIFIDDHPNKHNFGYNLMQQADFTITGSDISTTFRYWSDDIQLPLLEALLPTAKSERPAPPR